MTLSNKSGPPVNGITVRRKRMKNPHHIRLFFVQFAESMIPEMIAG